MTHGVGCSRGGQAQLHAGLFHDFLNVARVEAFATLADEQRVFRVEWVGAKVQIFVNGAACSGQDGDDAVFVALAANAEGFPKGGGARLRPRASDMRRPQP